ncbi:hypothetical protein [Ulvibacter litoralis]|uniref:RiboL-PSP-HEPN domain-containing protein n=1 Tax=Ulvibacter litoralis TaxID=227084 RepID=A0A1G7JG12_9FLAO|nr:hypothetical protein [Ulvibacter litoralis]GHC65042.1 hypothetical protein GCM10008083_32890 [Ulvibacter litoralis]SDF23870.1 hypothetical protein SAMN05421855_1132 [Ulvibacter litoralis]
MKSTEIRLFREKLALDEDNRQIRLSLHEHYEWLEAYWHDRYNAKNQIAKFSNEFGVFYWNIEGIKEIARKIAFYPPVGNSNNDFEPTITVLRATYFLRFLSELFEEQFPGTDEEIEIADNWNKSSFEALLTIGKQIRDNLFHGRKIELNEPQYTRNKELIKMASDIMSLVLDNLEQAEQV